MMEKVHRVILFGDSLILSGIQASIRLDKRCETVTCPPTACLEELVALRPDALIFVLDAVEGDLLYRLSRALPGLLLIGIDPETSRAIFWAGQEASDVTSSDLTRAIHHTGKTGPLKEPKWVSSQNEAPRRKNDP
jgi:hypothetical protein